MSNPLRNVARTCTSVPLGEEIPVLSNEILAQVFIVIVNQLDAKNVVLQ